MLANSRREKEEEDGYRGGKMNLDWLERERGGRALNTMPSCTEMEDSKKSAVVLFQVLFFLHLTISSTALCDAFYLL